MVVMCSKYQQGKEVNRGELEEMAAQLLLPARLRSAKMRLLMA